MNDEPRPDLPNPRASAGHAGFGYAPVELDEAPALSIISPFGPSVESFEETARTIYQQSLQQWEWLIVNPRRDALELLELYKRSDPRIRLIEVPAGVDAYEIAIAAARARYVLTLPTGTLLVPTAAEKCVWFLESRPEYDVVGGWTVALGLDAPSVDDASPGGNASLERNPHHPMNGRREGGLRGTLPEYFEWQWRSDVSAVERPQAEAPLSWPAPPRAAGAGSDVPPNGERNGVVGDLPDDLPFANRLVRTKRRLLLLGRWLTSRELGSWNLDLVSGLTAAGWEVTVVTTREDDDAWLPRFAGHSPDIFMPHRFLRPVDQPRFLRYLIRSRGSDVVLISHSEVGYVLLPYLRAHCPETAFLDYCMSEDEHWKSGGFPALSVKRTGLLDGSITSSEHLRAWMVARGADAARIAVTSPNVDVQEWQPDAARRAAVRAELGIDERTPVVLYPGRVAAQQQPRVFAQAMYRLVRQRLDFVAFVAGDGPELPWLRSFLEEKRLTERVRVFGVVEHDRLRDLFAASDIAFLPSHGAGIGLAAYQAMASGLAVVGVAIGGWPELVTLDCGVLVDHGAPDREAQAYTAALASLIREPGRIRAMGRAARERIERHFRIDQMHQAMLTQLTEVMRRRRADPRPAPSADSARAAAIEAVEHLARVRGLDALRTEGASADGTGGLLSRLVQSVLGRAPESSHGKSSSTSEPM